MVEQASVATANCPDPAWEGAAALAPAPAAAGEPVAWRAWSEGGQAWRLYHERLGADADLTKWEPLYAASAPRATSGAGVDLPGVLAELDAIERQVKVTANYDREETAAKKASPLPTAVEISLSHIVDTVNRIRAVLQCDVGGRDGVSGLVRADWHGKRDEGGFGREFWNASTGRWQATPPDPLPSDSPAPSAVPERSLGTAPLFQGLRQIVADAADMATVRHRVAQTEWWRGHRDGLNAVLSTLDGQMRQSMSERAEGEGVIPKLDQMAERLHTRLARMGLWTTREAVLDWLNDALTGLPPGRERDAALSRLAQPRPAAAYERETGRVDAGALREAGFIDDPFADFWSIAREEDEDLRVRAGRDYVKALRAALDRAGGGQHPSCAWPAGCQHTGACASERRCLGPVLAAGETLIEQAERPAAGGEA